MRTNIIKSIFFLVVLFLGSCNSELRMPEVQLVTLPKVTFDTTSDKLILDGIYSGKIVVDTYYKDLPVDANVIIAMNGNYAALKTFKAGVTTFPLTLAITSADLKTLFGLSTIVAGNYFEIGMDVKMQNGTWYPSFNTRGVAYGSGPSNLPGSSPTLKIAAVCGYNINLVTGSFHSVSASWNSEGDITITKDPTNQYIVYVAGLEAIEGLIEDKGPLKMVIDPTDYSVKAIKTVIASDAWGDHNIAYEGTGTLNPCNGTYTMNFTITVDEGTYGKFGFIFTKN